MRKSLHEIENLADAASVKVDDSFDPSFEGIATLATELRREIDEADIEVAEDV